MLILWLNAINALWEDKLIHVMYKKIKRNWNLLKNNKGYKNIVKSYNVDDYMININNKRLHELIKDDSDSGKIAVWYVIDYNLQKQYKKIPTKFKVSTILYTRLDLDLPSVPFSNSICFSFPDCVTLRRLDC